VSRSRAFCAAALAAAATLAPLAARADPATGGPTLCERERAHRDGEAAAETLAAPIALSWESTDFLEARGVCPSTGAFFRLHGSALIAVADFYGRIGAGALVGGRLALPSGIELSLTGDLAFEYVQNASIARTAFGGGPVTMGALFGNLGFERALMRFAPALRLLLPSSTLYRGSNVVGIDPALVWGGARGKRLELFGSFGYAIWAAVSSGGLNVWHGPNLTVGAALMLFPRLKLLVQLDGHGKAAADFQIERIALSGALRLRLGSALRLELAAGTVLAGIDRTDVTAALNVSVLDR